MKPLDALLVGVGIGFVSFTPEGRKMGNKIVCHMKHKYLGMDDEHEEPEHRLHFDEHLVKKAVAEMENVDGSSGEHWTIEETTRVMEQNGIKVNKYDWYYLMNMLHSDYSNIWGEDVAQYVKFGKAYINDPDASEGKVFCLWKAGKHH